MNFFLPFISALILTTIATPVVIHLAKHYHLVDDPKARYHPAHTHKGIIPRAGGAALFFGIALATLFFVPMNKVIAGTLLG